MTNRRWLDILWAVQPPSEAVLGWMDWPTGILYLNHAVENPSEFLAMVQSNRRDAGDRELLSTFTHENVHFLQVVTTGYMYRWVCELYGLLVRALKPFSKELPAYLEDPDPRTLNRIQNGIIDVDREDMQRTLARLDTPGPNGVTVRALLESHAFLVEKISHWQGLDAPGYLQMLTVEAASPEYRLCYDLARFRLGDGAAFTYFSLIVCLALCDDDPPLAFDVMIDAIASWPSLSQQPEAVDSDFANKVAALLPKPIGSSAEAAETIRPQHPFYGAVLSALNESASRGFNVLKFFTDPVGEMNMVAPDSLRPMVFRANSKEQFGMFLPPGFDRNMMEAMVIYSVLSAQVLGAASSSAPAYSDRLEGYG